MDNKHFFLKGTLLLTGAGFITKLSGLSIEYSFRRQLVQKAWASISYLSYHTLCFALSVGGIQTAISRFTAARAALKDEQGARDIFVLSGALSTVIALGGFSNSLSECLLVAVHILLEERGTPLLRLMAFSLPWEPYIPV